MNKALSPSEPGHSNGRISYEIVSPQLELQRPHGHLLYCKMSCNWEYHCIFMSSFNPSCRTAVKERTFCAVQKIPETQSHEITRLQSDI